MKDIDMGEEQNIDIFVFAHKQFETERTNPIYKIVCSRDCDIHSDNLEVIKMDCELSNVGFSEWQKIYEMYKNQNMLNKYVGLAHYHRYLQFSDDVNYVPDEKYFDDVFLNYGIMTKEPLYLQNLRIQYGFCHNVKDYDIMMDIIKNDFPEWFETAEYCTNSGIMFDSNIMILRKNDFLGLCQFVFSVLFKYCERVGIDKTSDESFIKHMRNNIDDYKKKHKPDDDEYLEQARICSYLAERLVIMYITRCLGKIMILKMVER